MIGYLEAMQIVVERGHEVVPSVSILIGQFTLAKCQSWARPQGHTLIGNISHSDIGP